MTDESSQRTKKLPRVTEKQSKLIAKIRERNLANPGLSAKGYVENIFRVIAEDSLKSADYVDLFCNIVLESDRGCVLVAAANVDNAIERLLRDFFASRSVTSNKDVDFFFKGQVPPLRSTALKIRLAFLLGLIDEDLKDSLSRLQKLRSDVAAHSREIMTLTSHQVTRIIDCLPGLKPIGKAKAEMMDKKSVLVISDGLPGDPNGDSPKLVFTAVVMMLLNCIERARKALKRRKPRHNSGSDK